MAELLHSGGHGVSLVMSAVAGSSLGGADGVAIGIVALGRGAGRRTVLLLRRLVLLLTSVSSLPSVLVIAALLRWGLLAVALALGRILLLTAVPALLLSVTTLLSVALLLLLTVALLLLLAVTLLSVTLLVITSSSVALLGRRSSLVMAAAASRSVSLTGVSVRHCGACTRRLDWRWGVGDGRARENQSSTR